MINNFLFITTGLSGIFTAGTFNFQVKRTPNIIIIYADGLGYGDVSCYGATSIKTPNIDRVAKQGLKFANALCTFATGTPSRYSVLAGEYAWRRKGTYILPGDAIALIQPGRTTLISVLKKAG